VFTAVTALGVTLQYVDYFVPIPELVGLVNHHRLNVLAGPPSLLCQLAEVAGKIEHRVDALIVYAEETDAVTKQRLAAIFGAPVSEIYQGAEGMLGYTCRAGNLHLSEDTALVELDPAGDTLGEAQRIVVTDLYRRTQPFIRYELNDLLEVGDRSCVCGSAFRLIDRIHGRSDSAFLLTGVDGHQVRLMPDYVRRSINQASADIIEYQAIQLSPDEIEIRLELADGADVATIQRTIVANLDHWATRARGRIGAIRFSDARPSRDPVSHKLVRVVSRCR
jgi:phenylacetate-CoA ligase